jgi:TPR repeat protein
MGLDFKSNKQYLQAERCFSEAAHIGHARAAGECARMHILGIGVPVDYARGLQLCQIAVDGGDGLGMYLTAECHFNGWGVDLDCSRALTLYKLAAEKGNIDAANACGDAHLNGDGTDCDPIKALEYFEAAAKGGHPEAATAAAFLRALPYPGSNYFTGIGVDHVSIETGMLWCERAAEDGNVHACAELGRRLVFGGRPPQQLDRAQALLSFASEHGDAKAKGTLSLLRVMSLLQRAYSHDWRNCTERDVIQGRALTHS